MQLEQAQAIGVAQHLPRQPRRSGVVPEFAVRVQFAHLIEVRIEQRRQRFTAFGRAPQGADAGIEFGLLLRPFVVQRVEAGTSMRVDVPERLVLLREVIEHLHKHSVLEDIGVIAGVEGVTVTEHRRAMCARSIRRGQRKR